MQHNHLPNTHLDLTKTQAKFETLINTFLDGKYKTGQLSAKIAIVIEVPSTNTNEQATETNVALLNKLAEMIQNKFSRLAAHNIQIILSKKTNSESAEDTIAGHLLDLGVSIATQLHEQSQHSPNLVKHLVDTKYFATIITGDDSAGEVSSLTTALQQEIENKPHSILSDEQKLKLGAKPIATPDSSIEIKPSTMQVYKFTPQPSLKHSYLIARTIGATSGSLGLGVAGFGLWATLTKAAILTTSIGLGLTLGAVIWPVAAALGVIALSAGIYMLNQRGCFDGVKGFFHRTKVENAEEKPLLSVNATQ